MILMGGEETWAKERFESVVAVTSLDCPRASVRFHGVEARPYNGLPHLLGRPARLHGHRVRLLHRALRLLHRALRLHEGSVHHLGAPIARLMGTRESPRGRRRA